MPAIIGTPLVFGTDPQLKPESLAGIPPETTRIKIRQRKNSWAFAFLRSAAGVRQFYIKRTEAGFKFSFEAAGNLRARRLSERSDNPPPQPPAIRRCSL